MGSYIPSTKEERQEMLAAAGYDSIRSLFKDVPAEVYLDKPLNLPKGMSELEVRAKMQELAGKNTVFGTILRGAGAYDHYIPSIVKYITSKEEFVTSYTPYQAEMSQGILQSIFEYQTMICDLTGMDTANASVYDGASAAAEAAAMCRDRRRSVALVSAAANPDVIATMQTYCFGAGTELRLVPTKNGRTDLDALKAMLTPDVCCVYVQQPNFYGQFEEAEQIAELTHAGGAKYIMGVNPIALAIMKTPAECGADIAVDDVFDDDATRLFRRHVHIGILLPVAEHLDDGLETAHADAARLRDADVVQVALFRLIQQRVQNGTCARRDAAGRHADLDDRLPFSRNAAVVRLGTHLLAERAELFQTFHNLPPKMSTKFSLM